MKNIVFLFAVCVTLAVGLPPQNQNRLRRQTSSPDNNQAQPNFGFGNFQFPTGSWPTGQGQGFDRLWSQPSSMGSLSSRGSFGFDLPNIEGAEGVTATAGMTCTSENGKKKCTKHQRQEKVRY